MSGLIQRVVNGLLIFTLALPACGWHVCRCASQPGASDKSASSQSPTPMRACCAKRLAAKTSSPQKTGLKARCCCDEIRWSQAVAKITADAGPKVIFQVEPAFGDLAPANRLRSAEFSHAAELPVVRAGPGDSVLIWQCRWQV